MFFVWLGMESALVFAEDVCLFDLIAGQWDTIISGHLRHKLRRILLPGVNWYT